MNKWKEKHVNNVKSQGKGQIKSLDVEDTAPLLTHFGNVFS